MQALKTIQQAMPLPDRDMQQAAELLQTATNNFENAEPITDKETTLAQDVKNANVTDEQLADILQELGISESEFEAIKNKKVSLNELVEIMASKIAKTQPAGADKAKRIRIAKAKAKAIQLTLELMN